MASAARDFRRGSRPTVYGDLAYDLDLEVREHQLRHAGEMPRHRERAAEEPKVRSVEKPAVREKQSLSILGVLGAVAVAALAVLMLISYVELTALSDDVATLRKELGRLETENVVLTAQYEQMYDLATVKAAAESAGMTKPSSEQIYYIDLSDGDSAVVHQKTEPGLLDRAISLLHHGIYTVVEYFD